MFSYDKDIWIQSSLGILNTDIVNSRDSVNSKLLRDCGIPIERIPELVNTSI